MYISLTDTAICYAGETLSIICSKYMCTVIHRVHVGINLSVSCCVKIGQGFFVFFILMYALLTLSS